MHRTTASILLAAAALAAAGAPTAASAASPAASADAAMRKGIRDFARSIDASASRIDVDCGATGAVGHRAACSGTFVLRGDAGSSTYRLTRQARVLRLSTNGLEYRVAARVVGARADGLPARVTGFSGFLQ